MPGGLAQIESAYFNCHEVSYNLIYKTGNQVGHIPAFSISKLKLPLIAFFFDLKRDLQPFTAQGGTSRLPFSSSSITCSNWWRASAVSKKNLIASASFTVAPWIERSTVWILSWGQEVITLSSPSPKISNSQFITNFFFLLTFASQKDHSSFLPPFEICS